MREKKDLWMVALIGFFTCGIYNIIVAIPALKEFYRLNDESEKFGKRIAYWAITYVAYIVLYTSRVVLDLTLEFTNASEIIYIASILLSLISLAMVIVFFILCLQEFEVVTQVSNKKGMNTTPGYKLLMAFFASNNIFTASLILQARLNKFIDIENNVDTVSGNHTDTYYNNEVVNNTQETEVVAPQLNENSSSVEVEEQKTVNLSKEEVVQGEDTDIL